MAVDVTDGAVTTGEPATPGRRWLPDLRGRLSRWAPEKGARWPWFAGGAAALLIVLYVGAAWAVADRVPAGVQVAGVDIGSQSRASAVAVLETDLAPRLDDPAPVTVGTAEDVVDPVAGGLTADLRATVDELVGFSLAPHRLLAHAFGSRDAEVVTAVDETALTAVLTDLGDRVRAEASDGAVTFEAGVPVATEASEGRELEVDDAVGVMTTRWPSADPIALPADITEPDVTQEDVLAAMETFAVPATSGPLAVLVGETRTDLAPEAFAPALRLEPSSDGLRPVVDGEVLRDVVLATNPGLKVEPQDARIVIEGGVPVVQPSAVGVTIDPDDLAAAVLPALTAADRSATVDTAVAQPALSTEQAQGLGVTEVVSEFSTNLTADRGRSENLRIAADTVNGTLLLPGDVFSLNGTLGPRTREKGYNASGAIQNGRFVQEVGGGVSQMATTLFNGAFFAGLEDVEHKAHSLYISRYPEGREATVNWNNVDLKFKNDTEYGVLIESWVAGGQVHTRFWSTKVWEITAGKSERFNFRQPTTITDTSAGCSRQSGQIGFDVRITRNFLRGGQVERTESFTTRYNAQNQVVCQSASAPTPDPEVLPE